MSLFDIFGTSITSPSPAPTTGTTVTGYPNGVPTPGTMQGGVFTPNK